MRIDRQKAVNLSTVRAGRSDTRSEAVAKLLSRELVQRLMPDMPGTAQAGLASEFWVEAVADRLSAQDWLALRETAPAKGAKLMAYTADSHDQQTTEGRMP